MCVPGTPSRLRRGPGTCVTARSCDLELLLQGHGRGAGEGLPLPLVAGRGGQLDAQVVGLGLTRRHRAEVERRRQAGHRDRRGHAVHADLQLRGVRHGQTGRHRRRGHRLTELGRAGDRAGVRHLEGLDDGVAGLQVGVVQVERTGVAGRVAQVQLQRGRADRGRAGVAVAEVRARLGRDPDPHEGDGGDGGSSENLADSETTGHCCPLSCSIPSCSSWVKR